MNIRNYSLDQIKTLIEEGTDVLVITSPASSDKNALSGQVESIRDPYWRTSLILANENTNIESLSHEIIQQALPDLVKDKTPAVSQVHKYLKYSALNGILPVIIVDDAHKLSSEVLEFILQLAELRYGESLFRIILFADETINEHFDVPKLKGLTAGVLHNIHTTSFAKGETEEIIEDVTSSYNESDEYLIAEEDTLVSSRKKTSRSLVGLLLLVIGLVAAFFAYSYLIDQKNVDISDVSIATETQQEEQTDYAEPVAPVEEDEQKIAEKIELLDEEESPESILDIDTPEVEIEEIVATPYEELPEYIEEVELIDVENEAVASIPKMDDENAFNLETVPDYLSNIKGPVWLRQQAVNSYVLQIISAQYKSNLRNLLSGQSGIQSQLSGYVKYTPSGKPRYLLLYGIYPDRKTATAAINDLPGKFQSIPPWPRTISDVLKELDKVSGPSLDEALSEIQVAESIETPYEDLPDYIEVADPPVVADEEALIPETDDENVFNLNTVPDILSGIKGPVWLRQQPDGLYVLQLLSARYMSNIKNLLRAQSGIQNQLAGYVKYTPSGKARYLLLYGIYPDRETAETAINELPIELKSIPPWPRKLVDAIKEINKISEPPTDEELSEGLLGLG